MGLKSILTVLTDTGCAAPSLSLATALARSQDAHLDVLALGVDPTQPGYYYAGANALIQQVSLERAGEDAKKINDFAEEYLHAQDIRYGVETAVAQIAGMSPLVGEHARFSDLVVLPKPYGPGRGAELEPLVETALFQGQAPVLIVPDEAPLETRPKRIVVGWNESRESLAAIRQALPFLIEAEMVSITVVDPPQHGPTRSDPGGSLTQFLARHGVNAEISVLAKTLPRVSDVLQRHVQDINAGMLVMGAYGHSRFREAILGGATRNTLENATIPVLMAH